MSCNIKLLNNISIKRFRLVRRDIMKMLLKILAFIPLITELLMLSIMFKKVGGVSWGIHIPIIILLAVVGNSIISKKKSLQRSGIGALIVLTVLLCIIGYYDYIKWFSSIVGIVIFMYFIIIRIAIRKSDNRVRINE